MSAFNETDVRRQKPGQPTGGQFAEKERGASGLALAPAPATQFDEEAVADVLRELYGDHPVGLDTATDVGHSITTGRMELPGGGTAQLHIAEDSRTGRIVEVTAAETWPMEHLKWEIDDGISTWRRDSNGLPEELIADTVRRTQKRAELQRAVNELVNHAQEKAAHQAEEQGWHRTLHTFVEDVDDQAVTLAFDDRRGSGAASSRKVSIRLDRHTGKVVGGHTGTDFGQVEMTPDSARQAAQRVDRELCFALDDYDAATRASTASFEARFGDAVRSLGAD